MAEAASGWNAIVARHAAVRFVDINLRGIGQVIFQNNPLTGLIFLAGIAWGAYAAGQPVIAVAAVVGVVVATTTAILLRVDEASLRQGLFGFNGVLVGCAVATFVAAPAMWLLVIVGAAVSTVAMLAVANVMKTWGTPALTFPFVLTTWFLVLAAYPFGAFTLEGVRPQGFIRSTPAEPLLVPMLDASTVSLVEAWLKGPAQVFLADDWISGLLVVAGLAVSSLWAALLALVGSAVGVLTALALGAGVVDIDEGLFGFSAVLTAIALGCTFYQPGARVLAFMLLGTVFTVIVQAALDTALSPVGVPTFTAPFVFVTWLFLLPKADLKPHPHAPIENGLVGRGS